MLKRSIQTEDNSTEINLTYGDTMSDKWDIDKVDKNLSSLNFPSVGDELGFSWSPCWLCERKLGGNRHELKYVGEDTEIYHEEICEDCVQYVANGELPIED